MASAARSRAMNTESTVSGDAERDARKRAGPAATCDAAIYFVGLTPRGVGI